MGLYEIEITILSIIKELHDCHNYARQNFLTEIREIFVPLVFCHWSKFQSDYRLKYLRPFSLFFKILNVQIYNETNVHVMGSEY